MRVTRAAPLLCALAALVFGVRPAFARQDDAPGDQSDPHPPTLDELLGIKDADAGTGPEDLADEQAEEELRRRLSAEEIKHTFTLVLDSMAVSARLLDEELDPGIGTQRLQREILARLHRLVDEAHHQCTGGGGAPAERRPSPTQQPGKRDGSENAVQKPGPAGASAQGGGPPFRQDDAPVVFDENRTEWGQLPQRIRDMLLQGRGEKFSSLYQRLTQEYYRRLAEEGSS